MKVRCNIGPGWWLDESQKKKETWWRSGEKGEMSQCTVISQADLKSSIRLCWLWEGKLIRRDNQFTFFFFFRATIGSERRWPKQTCVTELIKWGSRGTFPLSTFVTLEYFLLYDEDVCLHFSRHWISDPSDTNSSDSGGNVFYKHDAPGNNLQSFIQNNTISYEWLIWSEPSQVALRRVGSKEYFQDLIQWSQNPINRLLALNFFHLPPPPHTTDLDPAS